MITKAKVNIQAVRQFEQAVAQCRDYSPKFDRGFVCIDTLYNCLENYEKKIEEQRQRMQNAQSKLAIKIRNIEEILAKLTAQLNELESDLADLESDLNATDSEITSTNEEGETISFPNPAYLAIEAQIAAVEGEIEGVRSEMYPHQCRLERANEIDGELSQLIDELNSVLYSLSEKRNECKELRYELESIRDSNSQKGQYVVDNLKKIQQIVAAYMRIKMLYNATTIQSSSSTPGAPASVNINININTNRSPVQERRVIDQQITEVLSTAEIHKHNIKFDAEKHIAEYDNKTFGGRYNPYDERIKGTSADNPILGFYEGCRGESKYLPTNRSAEGIVVIDILKGFGLDGIEYRNGEPDFEVCADAVVTISAMSENRDNYLDSNGNPCLGNFSQADIQLAKSWNFEERDGRTDWTPREVFEYRKANKLTWHEKCDTKTMVLVRSEINAFFKHIGGCSECRLRDAGNGEDEFDE